LAEIALALEQALERRRTQGEAGRTTSRVLACGAGWRIADVMCTSGPQDRPFEEQHTHYAIAIVLAGSFQYRSPTGRVLMTPGSLMLGRPGQCFECGHEHAEGDRCVSFWYAPDYFERLVADAGHGTHAHPGIPRIPPLRVLAPVVAQATASVMGTGEVSWNELGVELAVHTVSAAAGVSPSHRAPANAEARVTRLVRRIDRCPDAPFTLDTMSRDAGVSPYHFLRTFERLTGVTPHQYILRARLRQAALALTSREDTILDIALQCGFGDVSNFNRTFRAEFGRSPRAYRLGSRERRSCD
jgi:AraC family transcriptional regulator